MTCDGPNTAGRGSLNLRSVSIVFRKTKNPLVDILEDSIQNDKEISSEKTNAGGKEIYAQPSNKGEGEGGVFAFLVNTSKKI